LHGLSAYFLSKGCSLFTVYFCLIEYHLDILELSEINHLLQTPRGCFFAVLFQRIHFQAVVIRQIAEGGVKSNKFSILYVGQN
jgi:hypothetical protein